MKFDHLFLPAQIFCIAVEKIAFSEAFIDTSRSRRSNKGLQLRSRSDVLVL